MFLEHGRRFLAVRKLVDQQPCFRNQLDHLKLVQYEPPIRWFVAEPRLSPNLHQLMTSFSQIMVNQLWLANGHLLWSSETSCSCDQLMAILYLLMAILD